MDGPDEDGRGERSSDWFTPQRNENRDASKGRRAPDWSAPRSSGQGGFTGASDAGGYGAGPSGQYGTGGGQAAGGQYGPAGSGQYGTGQYGESPYRLRSESGPYQPYDPNASIPPGGGNGGSSGGGGGGGGGGWDNDPPRRKRSRAAVFGPMVGAVVLAVLAGVSIYAFAGSAGGCGSNALTLSVVAAPDIASAVNETAKDFNSEKHSVGGKCVKAVVSSADPAAVTTLLSGQGVSQGETQRPDVWIPDSTLWADLVQTSDKGRTAVRTTQTSVAQTPIVVAMPKALAAKLAASGMIAQPSWDNLLTAAGGMPGGAVTKNQTIPSGLIRLTVPDPTRNAAGMASLALTNTLLTSDPNKNTIFTGIVRTVQHATTPTVAAALQNFKANGKGQYPVALAPEQAVWRHNQGKPADPAVAIYPLEGTATLDYPYTVTTSDSAKAQAAALLEKAMDSANTQNRVRALGFRSSDGKAPDSYGAATGVSPRKPRPLPTPKPAELAAIMQAWSKLGLSIRMLSIFDVSGSMADKIPGTNLTRIQGTAQAAQSGLGLLTDDTELGQWIFSTDMVGTQPWKQIVPVGSLSDRAGSITRRELIQNALAKAQVKPNGNTALYRTILAAYRYMKKTYEPDKINSILLLTDGKNDDPGPGGLNNLQQAVGLLKGELDPKRPVKVFMLGFGRGADRNELNALAAATEGDAQVVNTLPGVQKFLLEAIAKRLTAGG